ncbi:MAG: flagellar protein FlgN [Magnetococcales bacterium]|nr:flagellar protein FlgN [Magnetococcales bacterium]
MSSSSFDAVAETQRLITLLEPLIGQFERLMPLLERERLALKARNPEELEMAARQVEEVLMEIRRMDLSRQAQSQRMGQALGLAKDAMNLKELDLAMGGNTGLLAYRQKLRDRIEQADRSNRENQAIFKGVLVATETMLRALKGSAQGQSTAYDRRGFRQSGPSYHFLSKQF